MPDLSRADCQSIQHVCSCPDSPLVGLSLRFSVPPPTRCILYRKRSVDRQPERGLTSVTQEFKGGRYRRHTDKRDYLQRAYPKGEAQCRKKSKKPTEAKAQWSDSQGQARQRITFNKCRHGCNQQVCWFWGIRPRGHLVWVRHIPPSLLRGETPLAL